MTFLDAVVLFLSQRFPDWGNCRFGFDPEEQALLVFCAQRTSLSRIQQDFMVLQSFDIGLQQIVVLTPDGQPWAVLPMRPVCSPSVESQSASQSESESQSA
jgi:hypothetical protein